MRKVIVMAAACLFALGLNAQERIAPVNDICATNAHLEVLQQQDPGLERRMQAIEQFTARVLQEDPEARAVNGVITIPVVVHVLWNVNNPQENLSEAQIQSQIDVLNEDFRRLNADAVNTPEAFQPVAADFELEFCLATVDPDGNPTNGIQRRSTTRTAWGYSVEMKQDATGGLDAWPYESYLNMWACNIGGGYLGFATFPGGDPAYDGVVVGSNYFGSDDYDINNDFYLSEPYHLGRIMTHEVGHWINLRHVWGDGPCSDDDFVDDTPRSDDPNWGCPTDHVSCGTVDMIENYMDYTDDNCANLLTIGQKARARAIFEPGGFRAEMVNSLGCGTPTPVCLPPSGIFAQASDNEAVLSFNGAMYGVSHAVELAVGEGPFEPYATFNDPETGTVSTFTITFTGLESCTEHHVRITSTCVDPSGVETAPVYTFKTTGPECVPPTCDVPENLYATNITFTQATLGWDAVEAASEYKVQGRLRGGLGLFVRTRTVTSNSFRTNNLFPFLTYEFRVQSVCSGIPNSYYSGWHPFTLNPFGLQDGPGELSFTNENLKVVDLFDTDHIISAYPNPSRGDVQVSYRGPDLGKVKVELSDITGKALRSYDMELLQNGTWQQDLSSLQTGLYFLSFWKDGVLIDTERLTIAK